LQPELVVLDDVLVVAKDRDSEPTNAIFDEDHDVLFVPTSNRADLLEPDWAVTSGRIDGAVGLPPPDADGRLRLRGDYLRSP
jgi:hypothetical protein